MTQDEIESLAHAKAILEPMREKTEIYRAQCFRTAMTIRHADRGAALALQVIERRCVDLVGSLDAAIRALDTAHDGPAALAAVTQSFAVYNEALAFAAISAGGK